MKSIQPRKQRKMQYNAPLHKKRKWLSAHLEENLLLKYDHRSIPIVKGDTVKVMRGSFKGHEDKVANVHIHKQIIEVEGITLVKADGTKIARPLHPSNVMITKINLTDKWRRKKLERGLPEEKKKEIEKEGEEQLKVIEQEEQLATDKMEEETALEEEKVTIPEEKEEPKPKVTKKKTTSTSEKKKKEPVKEPKTPTQKKKAKTAKKTSKQVSQKAKKEGGKK